ncbi:hypothetical protein LRHMDP2_2677 [Lacticaseibacillus rhamnosus LRHMDP2]|nr:hypothetical protein LRHMDP2_2677 [Lacticaseibacillus rhamnosus LRHMDP2]
MFWVMPITRSPAQESACKDLGPQWPKCGYHVRGCLCSGLCP